jgi:hypothetical protein
LDIFAFCNSEWKSGIFAVGKPSFLLPRPYPDRIIPIRYFLQSVTISHQICSNNIKYQRLLAITSYQHSSEVPMAIHSTPRVPHDQTSQAPPWTAPPWTAPPWTAPPWALHCPRGRGPEQQHQEAQHLKLRFPGL